MGKNTKTKLVALVEITVEADNQLTLKEAINEIKRELPIDVTSVSRTGYYHAKRGKVISVTPAQPKASGKCSVTSHTLDPVVGSFGGDE